jgi:hypothetical protein
MDVFVHSAISWYEVSHFKKKILEGGSGGDAIPVFWDVVMV